MRGSKPRTWAVKSAWLLGALALTACQQTPPYENPVDLGAAALHSPYYRIHSTVLKPQVEPVTLVYKPAFSGSRANLSDSELSRLVEFLEESGASEGARIELDGPRIEGGYHDALTASRIAALRSALERMGMVGMVPDQPVDVMTKPNGSVFVAVTKATVIQPDCTVQQPTGTARPMHISSCSTSTALGMMIADPLDLQRGRDPGAADGEYSSQSIQRYREDKIKGIEAESTSSSE